MAATLTALALLASACGSDNTAASQAEPATAVQPAQQPLQPKTSEPASVPEPEQTVTLDPEEPIGPNTTTPESSDAAAGQPAAEHALSDTTADELATVPDPSEPSRDAAPEELAADPILQWREFDPVIGEVARLRSAGDGRVQARAAKTTTERTGDNTYLTTVFTGPVVVTTDGIHWGELPLPEGIKPNVVNIASDLWLVTGRDSDDRETGIPRTLEQVFVSRDRGATWAEVPVDSAPPVAHSVDQHLDVSSALVSGGHIVLSSEIYTYLDVEALLADRGLISESQTAIRVGFIDGSLIVGVFSDPEVVGLVEFTAEELNLSADQQQLLTRPIGAEPFSWGVRIYAGDASGLAPTAEYEGYAAGGSGSPDGFLLRVERPRGLDPRHLSIASPDGRSWSERSLDVEGEQVTGSTTAGACLTVWRTNLNAGYSRIETLCHDGSSTRDAILQGVTLDRFGPGVSAGPAGIVAVVRPLRSLRSLFGSSSDFFFQNAIPRGSVTKDGYELRIGEPDVVGITLWDLEEDREIREFSGALVMDGTPDGARESGVGETFAVTFEDPETGTDLVTYTWRDLSEVIGPASQPQSDRWVGWSVDGVDWEWQDAVDVFGSDLGSDIDLAVGTDFLLAHGTTGDHRPRWFLARVPGG